MCWISLIIGLMFGSFLTLFLLILFKAGADRERNFYDGKER